MTEPHIIQENIAKWVRRSYYLIAAYVIVILAWDEVDIPILLKLTDPLLLGLLFLFIERRASRVAAFVIILYGVVFSTDYALLALGSGPLFFSSSEPGKVDALYSILYLVMAFVGFRVGTGSQKFHAAVESRIVFKNVVFCNLLAICYLILVTLAGIFIYLELPEEMRTFHIVSIFILLFIATIFLGIWRKLPGTGRFPTVIWGDEVQEQPNSIAYGESLMDINRLANTQRDQDGNYIVSPGGVFSKSYGLTDEQFAVYLDWHKSWFKTGWTPIFTFIVLGALISVIILVLPDYWSNILMVLIFVGLICWIVWLQLKQLKDFHKTFPDAPITKPRGSTLRRVIFAIASAPVIGSNLYASFAILFAPLFMLPMVFRLGESEIELSLWIVIGGALLGLWMIILGIGIFYARYTFKKIHNRPLTAEALAEVNGVN